MFERTRDVWLAAFAYEISNFARAGRSRHNLGYWRGADYLGGAKRLLDVGGARCALPNTPAYIER